MEASELNQILLEAADGNEWARERLIRHYQPFILNTVGHLCNRYVTWSDEETSIGLISLNRAIDTYSPSGGRTFQNYIYLLIKRDLIDFHRRERREHHLSLEVAATKEGHTEDFYETRKSLAFHQVSVRSENLVEEILELDQELARFHISFEELEFYCPKHQDTRDMLMKMARDFVLDEGWIKELLQKRRFPMASFTKKTDYRPKTIERHRKYLITLILLNLHSEWTQLFEFVKTTQGGGES